MRTRAKKTLRIGLALARIKSELMEDTRSLNKACCLNESVIKGRVTAR